MRSEDTKACLEVSPEYSTSMILEYVLRSEILEYVLRSEILEYVLRSHQPNSMTVAVKLSPEPF